MLVITVITLVLLLLTLKFLYKFLFPKCQIDREGYKEGWFGKGPRAETEEDTSIRPFKIQVPDEVLKDLQHRLENTRFEDSLEGAKFLYGFNSGCLRKVVDYWKTEYNWREQEKALNNFPQFKTRIEGLDVHFLHVHPDIPEGSQVKVIPLLLIHGWPGSVVEFYKTIPLLTTVRPGHDFVFEVVCPSLPGFGFSESPHCRGFSARAAARVYLSLMERLGHPKFYVQGGDWGSYVASLIARYYSPRVLGLHVNMYFFLPLAWDFIKYCLVNYLPFLVQPEEYRILFPVKAILKLCFRELGYFHMQATKPDTLGASMADSPAGMAAYLLEKFSTASDRDAIYQEDGLLTTKFTLDELLTNVMMYWVNNNFTAAARFYKENLKDYVSYKHERVPVTVPSGVAVFPNELIVFPKMLMSQQMKNVVSHSIMPRGGHFAALEEPQLLADDIWKFVKIAQAL